MLLKFKPLRTAPGVVISSCIVARRRRIQLRSQKTYYMSTVKSKPSYYSQNLTKEHLNWDVKSLGYWKSVNLIWIHISQAPSEGRNLNWGHFRWLQRTYLITEGNNAADRQKCLCWWRSFLSNDLILPTTLYYNILFIKFLIWFWLCSFSIVDELSCSIA